MHCTIAQKRNTLMLIQKIFKKEENILLFFLLFGFRRQEKYCEPNVFYIGTYLLSKRVY